MTDQEISDAFKKVNYFVRNERAEVAESLLRCALNKRIGASIGRVLIRLELIKVGSPVLTAKGKDYLYETFKLK